MKHGIFGWLPGLGAVLLWAPIVVAQEWARDLTPIDSDDWSPARAVHLLERAGFGGTPEAITHLAAMTPEQAVAFVVRFEGAPSAVLPPFDHSGVFEAGLVPFPPSRPAVTDAAEKEGHALGIAVKPGGNLVPTTDFRRVYATAIEGWMAPGRSAAVLGGHFTALPVFG